MTTFDSISAKLVTLLEGITGIGTVTDYPTAEFATYPGANVFMSAVENELLDSASNLIGRRFTIRVLDELKTSPSATEARMRDLAEAVILALNSSDDLDGEVAILKPATCQAGFVKGELGEYRTVVIDVVCQSATML